VKRPLVPRGLRARLTVLLATVVALSLGGRVPRHVQRNRHAGQPPDRQRPQAGRADLHLPGHPDHRHDAQVGGPGGEGLRRRAAGRSAPAPASTSSGSGVQQPITNEAEVLNPNPGSAKERRRGAADARRLLAAPPGFSTISLEQAGPVRMFVQSVPTADGKIVGLIGIAEPLGAVSRAKSSVARTFVLTGIIVAAIRARRRLARRLGHLAAPAAHGPDRRRHRRRRARPPRRPRAAPRDEVRTLAEAFDRMLDRLEDAFARQRAFVSDASHELRTPLTVIRGQLEVLARQPRVTSEDVGRVERTVLTEIVRMERLVEDLLLLARADEGELVRPEPLDLDSYVTELFDGPHAHRPAAVRARAPSRRRAERRPGPHRPGRAQPGAERRSSTPASRTGSCA